MTNGGLRMVATAVEDLLDKGLVVSLDVVDEGDEEDHGEYEFAAEVADEGGLAWSGDVVPHDAWDFCTTLLVSSRNMRDS